MERPKALRCKHRFVEEALTSRSREELVAQLRRLARLMVVRHGDDISSLFLSCGRCHRRVHSHLLLFLRLRSDACRRLGQSLHGQAHGEEWRREGARCGGGGGFTVLITGLHKGMVERKGVLRERAKFWGVQMRPKLI